MSFQSPWLLLGLLAIPLLVGLYATSQQRRRAYAVRFTNLALLNQVMGKGPGFRRHIPAILFIAGIAGLLFSMARPQATIRIPKGQTSVMLAVDVSGSMAATDVQPTRIEAAIAAGRTLIDKLPSNAQVGLVIFKAAVPRSVTRSRWRSPNSPASSTRTGPNLRTTPWSCC